MQNKIYIGAAYYPELWDESEVDKDIERCKALGVNVLRVGEFAWKSMEPKEGEYHFDWLLRVVDKLHAAGIATVMCTPTCTPPRWLLNKYEEVLLVRHNGKRTAVASRCHPCKTSPIMREKNRAIVTQMAKVFGKHPGVIGWQIDNEIFPYDGGCYCPLCIQAFRDRLRKQFGTVENLNKAWGMARWSLSYDSFDDVLPPRPDEWRHPSLCTAWWHFQCAQIVSYVDEQADILHAYTSAPVGTDMMSTNSLDYYAVNKKLDVVQHNHYNRAQDLPYTAMWYDFLRCVKDRPFWITETQVGWNGSEVAESGYRPVGNCYANTWLPIAKGGEMNMYWLFRAHPGGHEIGHGALYSAAGRVYRVSDEVKRASDEMQKCGDVLTNSQVKSRIALHFSNTADRHFVAAPLVKVLDGDTEKNFAYGDTLLHKVYDALRHYNVDVIDTPHTLDGYDVLLSPFVATLDENGCRERVLDWVQKGGKWIVGPLSDILDGNTVRYTHAPFSFLEDAAGVYTKYTKPMDNREFRAAWKDGAACDISVCFDAFEPQKGTENLVAYTGDEFDGLSVVTRRKVGKGEIILLGSVLSHDDLLRLIDLPPIADASRNVILTQRSGKQSAVIAVETENKEGYVILDGKYVNRIDGKTYSGKIMLQPYQVAVLQKV